MKTEMKPKTEPNPYAPTPELLAAADALHVAREKRHKLDRQVDATAAQLVPLDADVARLAAERGTEEGALALCDEADVKRHEKAIERLTTELEAKERELRRARARFEALEGMAAGLDEEVAARGGELNVEAGIWLANLKSVLSTDLAEAVKPLLGVMSKARAIRASIGGVDLTDFLEASYLPQPEGFMRVMTPGSGWFNQGTNLLSNDGDETQQAEAKALFASLMPVQAGIRAAASHVAYVPLAKRPKPYARKGVTVGGDDFFARRRAQAQSLDKPPASRPAPQGEPDMGAALVESIGARYDEPQR